jgi:flagellar basal body-associated protein FliL
MRRNIACTTSLPPRNTVPSETTVKEIKSGFLLLLLSIVVAVVAAAAVVVVVVAHTASTICTASSVQDSVSPR